MSLRPTFGLRLGAAAALGVFAYLFGLGSQYIPKNTDEYVYEHIARLTAASGRLLPLQSELAGTRDTKPPLLFWQGILSTGWGAHWTLLRLRLPSALYTLLTAALVFLLGLRLARDREGALVAALAFLGFYSTYRYGRPYLANPPEVFWLFLPVVILLRRPTEGGEDPSFPTLTWLSATALGFVTGIGLLTMSFSLVAPVIVGAAAIQFHGRGATRPDRRGHRIREFLRLDAPKLAFAGAVALGLFSLWFAIDPDPRRIWTEFVLCENFGKFAAQAPHAGYISALFWGGSSLGMFALAFLANAGLLAFPVLGLCWERLRRRTGWSSAEASLWIWIGAWFLVFCLPSVRSARNLLPAMPALAVLCGLAWRRIPGAAFRATLALAALLLATLGWLALQLGRHAQATGVASGALYPPCFWAFLAVAGALIALGILAPRHASAICCAAPLLVYIAFAAAVQPLDRRLGQFSAAAVQAAAGRPVWVPCDRRAKDEGYRFLLPGADIHGYFQPAPLLPSLADLSLRHRRFVAEVPFAVGSPAVPSGCRILGERLDIRGNQSGREIRSLILGRRLFRILFVKELLVASPFASARSPAPASPADECR